MTSREEFRELLAKWQERLGLEDWQIALDFKADVTHGPDNVLCTMRIHRSVFYPRATLEVSEGALDHEKMPDSIDKDLIVQGEVTQFEKVQTDIVHELLHLRLRDIMEASDIVRGQLSPTVTEVWDRAFRRAEEDTCERLAMALVRTCGS